MPKIANLVQMTSTVEGVADANLLASTGFQAFATAFPDSSTSNRFYYFIRHRTLNEWEVGLGYLSAGLLVRASVIDSSNGGNLVSFSAGQKIVTNDLPAQFMVSAPSTIVSTGTLAAPLVLTSGQSGSIITNTGATEKSYNTLPTPEADESLEFSFVVMDADGLRITAPAGVIIYNGDLPSTVGGFYESAYIGSLIKIRSMNATTYITEAATGAWNQG